MSMTCKTLGFPIATKLIQHLTQKFFVASIEKRIRVVISGNTVLVLGGHELYKLWYLENTSFGMISRNSGLALFNAVNI